MARGPDGFSLPTGLQPETEKLNRMEFGLASGLEQVIDSVLRGHRHGTRFVYGIHQALSPGMMRALERRYRETGWMKAVIRPGETGASMMILSPETEA
jgi:hypothetical protein